jgi:hypothetical protein
MTSRALNLSDMFISLAVLFSTTGPSATLQRTGQAVNLEAYMLAKHVEKLLAARLAGA